MRLGRFWRYLGWNYSLIRYNQEPLGVHKGIYTGPFPVTDIYGRFLEHCMWKGRKASSPC